MGIVEAQSNDEEAASTATQKQLDRKSLTLPMFNSEEFSLPPDTVVNGKVVTTVIVTHSPDGDIYRYV